ncbi:hypothetical protein CHARACLAT_031364 [Characodon lateralis]|uniref:Uncharacterized protein n=1 Tax=Characodon lateralis TaxID=208331 RepID=A0ABU7ERL6_9TELE|nr:hypothetical protein [Characodon lateralis]
MVWFCHEALTVKTKNLSGCNNQVLQDVFYSQFRAFGTRFLRKLGAVSSLPCPGCAATVLDLNKLQIILLTFSLGIFSHSYVFMSFSCLYEAKISSLNFVDNFPGLATFLQCNETLPSTLQASELFYLKHM